MAMANRSPRPERELTLLLAGTAAYRARHRDRLPELTERVDLAALEAFLLRQGMTVLIGRRLEEAAGDALPDGFRARVREQTQRARRQGVSQQMLTVRLTAALEAEGVRALAIKGPLLGERLYDDAGARISADIDLLVAESDLSRAVEIVVGIGYERQEHAAASGSRRPVLHERLVHPADLPPVELHWRVHWYEERFSADLLERCMPGPEGWLLPRPADELVELLLLYARDGFAGLRLASDVAAWWDRYGAELDAAEVTEVASAYPATTRALATASLLAEQLVGVPAARMLSAETLSLASRRAVRFANWSLDGAEGQISANVSLIDWLLAPTGQWRALVRRHVLLTRQDLLTAWPEAGSSVPRVLTLRLLHAVRVVRRYTIAAWTVFRRGVWAPLPASWRGSRVA
jgi:Uncharacterised nucleotidyltransferase